MGGLSQGVACLLGKQTEQTFDLQIWESKFPGPRKEQLPLHAGGRELLVVTGLALQAPQWGRRPAWKAGEAGGEQGPSETPRDRQLCGRFM